MRFLWQPLAESLTNGSTTVVQSFVLVEMKPCSFYVTGTKWLPVCIGRWIPNPTAGRRRGFSWDTEKKANLGNNHIYLQSQGLARALCWPWIPYKFSGGIKRGGGKEIRSKITRFTTTIDFPFPSSAHSHYHGTQVSFSTHPPNNRWSG